MRKTTALRINTELLIKSKDKVNKMVKYSTYSDYINDLISRDILEEDDKDSFLEEIDIKEDEKFLKNDSTKYKLHARLLKEINSKKKDVVDIYFKSTSKKIRNLMWESMVEDLNRILKIKTRTVLIEKLLSKIRELRDVLELKDEEEILKLCDISNREKKYLKHLAIRYGYKLINLHKQVGGFK